jgi:hypothetical protein
MRAGGAYAHSTLMITEAEEIAASHGPSTV